MNPLKIVCEYYHVELDHCFRKDGMCCPELKSQGKKWKCSSKGTVIPDRKVSVFDKFNKFR